MRNSYITHVISSKVHIFLLRIGCTGHPLSLSLSGRHNNIKKMSVFKMAEYFNSITEFIQDSMAYTRKYVRIKALQACIIPRHEILIQYKCKKYLTEIKKLICASKIMKYLWAINDENQRKINYIFPTSILHVPKHV